jgi:ArsR family transcriptional regulator
MDVDTTPMRPRTSARRGRRVELPVLEDAPARCCPPLDAAGMSEQDAEVTARVFKALADPHRVRIVNLLANAPGPACVCDLTPQLGLSQPTVSFHLRKLVEAGLLRRERRGVWSYYGVDRDALARLATIFGGGGTRGGTGRDG